MLNEGQPVHPVAFAAARILDAAGDVVGAGFIVGPRHVATCAHVVSVALGGSPESPAAPSGRLRLDLPMGQAPSREVDAVVESWRAIDPATGIGDIALLALDDPPPGLRVPPLYRPDDLWGHRFRVLGFPAGMQDGVWAAGELRDRQGTRWLQLQGDAGGPPVAAGFSGAPVWDDEVGAVVGMTVASHGADGDTTAYLVPIDEVFDVDPRLMPNPYRGLEPFGEEHADVFYGREDEVERLIAVLDRQPVVAVVGRTGTGKSSLVRAGLLPRLRQRGTLIHELRPDPMDVGGELDRLVPAAPDGDEPAAGTLLFVDQFEELIGAGPTGVASTPAPAQQLFRRLVELAGDGGPRADGRPPVRVVVTLRWEAMNELLTGEVVEAFEHGLFSLTPMSRDQLRRAVEGPTARAPGLRFEPGLVERILDDAVAEPGHLPLVESLLTQLWASRRGGTLQAAAYDEAGGVKGAVARLAEQVVGELPAAETERLPRLFAALARPDEGGGFVRRPALLEDLPPGDQQLVEHLARRRLLVVGQEAGTGGRHTVELAHQALIDHWPLLRSWLEHDRDFLQWYHEADRRQRDWERADRDDGALLRGVALACAGDWLGRRPGDIAPPVRDYVAASRDRAEGDARRRRALVATGAVIVGVALLLGSLFAYQRRVTGREQAGSDSRALATLSADTAATDPAWSILLALVAYDRSPTPEAENALFRQYVAYRSTEAVLSGARGEIIAVDASSDGRVVVGRTDSGTVTLWQREPDQPVVTTQLPDAGVVGFDVDEAGRRMALVSDRGVEVYDIAGESVAWTIPVDDDEVPPSVVLGADGTAVVGRASPDTTGVRGSEVLEVWEPDGETARRVDQLAAGAGDELAALGLGPDPGTVIVDRGPAGNLGRSPTTAEVWRVGTGATVGLPGGDTEATGRTLSADGVVVSCHSSLDAGSVTRHDLRDGSVRSYPIPPAGCTMSPQVDAAGELLVTDGTFVVDLVTGAVEGQPGLAFDAITTWGRMVTDGDRRLSLATDGNIVVLTELLTGDQVLPAERSRLDIGSQLDPFGLPRWREVQALPDGRNVLTVSEDSSQLVVASTEGRGDVVATAVRPPPAQAPEVGEPRVKPDGTLVADLVSPTAVQIRSLPGLELVSEISTAGGGSGSSGSAEALHLSTKQYFWNHDHLLTYEGPLVRWWDPATGRLAGELDLRTTGLVDDSDAANLWMSRAPEPGQLAVFVLGEPDLLILDAATGRRVDAIPVGEDAIAFMFAPGGRYFVVLHQGELLEMWDRFTGTRVLGPLPSLGSAARYEEDFIVKFLDEQGTFLLGDRNQLRWFRPGSATPTRRLDLGTDRTPIWASSDGGTILYIDDRIEAGVAMPPLRIDPDEWRSTLCRVVGDRALTAEERAQLPSAVPRSPCG